MLVNRSFVGTEAPITIHDVEKGQIRRFAKALGLGDPAYFDEAVAKTRGYPGVVAPPTFAAVLVEEKPLKDVIGIDPRYVLHAEQALHFLRPIVAGDKIRVHARVSDIHEKRSAGGPMTFVVIERFGETLRGVRVFESRETLVLFKRTRTKEGDR
jgi:acyl dehydratase